MFHSPFLVLIQQGQISRKLQQKNITRRSSSAEITISSDRNHYPNYSVSDFISKGRNW